MELWHTFTPPAKRGRGLAKIVVDAALRCAALNGMTVDATCSYARRVRDAAAAPAAAPAPAKDARATNQEKSQPPPPRKRRRSTTTPESTRSWRILLETRTIKPP